jgi:predicted DNA-binding transcriptional regulator YafY
VLGGLNVKTSIDTNKRAFQMIKILAESGKVMKAREIADILQLKNTRSIAKYKEMILMLGIPIKSVGGNRGGYYIDIPKKINSNEMHMIEISNIPEELKKKIKLLNCVMPYEK